MAVLVMAVGLPTALGGNSGPVLADTVYCPPDITWTVDENIYVDGWCLIQADVNGNIYLDADTDSVNYDSGYLNGNIEADACYQVHVGSGTYVDGNVEAYWCDVFVGATEMNGNVYVEHGDLKIFAGAMIWGNVKVEDGTCDIDPDAMIFGNTEGACYMSTSTGGPALLI